MSGVLFGWVLQMQIQMQMQEGREEPYKAPKVSALPSRTHPTHFLFPSTAPKDKGGRLRGAMHSANGERTECRRGAIAFAFGGGRLRGSRKVVEGVRGRRRKTAWGLMGFSPPPLLFAFVL